MARRSRQSVERRIRSLLDEYEPIIAQAFLDAIADLRDGVALRVLVEALERRDIEAAIAAVNLDRAAFRGLENAIAQAFEAGGVAGANGFPRVRAPGGGVVLVRFDSRNMRAERILRDISSREVTRILDDTRLMLRTVMSERLAQGQGPTAIARDIAGRVDRASNRRTGGLLGLTSTQERQAATVRSILADPEQIRGYFIQDRATGAWKPRYKTTDRRFDRSIMRAINEGRALDAPTIAKIASRHHDKMLLVRGETVARTEVLASVNAGRREAFLQGLEKTGYTEADVERVWDSAGDNKVRDSHRHMDGQTVQGLSQPYSNGLMHPGDPNGPPKEIIQCRCIERIRIRYFRGE